MTRRGFFSSGIAALLIPTSRERLALTKIKRLAEAEAGIWDRRNGPPIIPRPGTIWRRFWDLASAGLEVH